MADDDSLSGSSGKRRRRAPVLDLKAMEVPPSEVAAESPAAPPEDPPPPPVKAAPEKSQAEASPPPPERPARDEPPPSRPSNAWWMHFATGAGGGLLVFIVLWLAGVLSGSRDASTDLSPRLAALDKQLKDIAARPASAGIDLKVLDDIAARLGKLETAQATPRPPATDPVALGRLTATENAVKSAADNMAGLSRRADAVDAAVRDTNSRIDKLAAILAEVQATARQAAAGSDRASRFAIAAGALRNAVERGDPFTAEIAVVKPLASDQSIIAALEPFAGSGLPSDAVLGLELAAIARALPRASAGTRDGGVLDRLAANAEKLVRIRRIDATPGDDRNAILARIGQRAAQGDIKDAMAELAKLGPEAGAPAQAWLAKVEARNKAIEASRKLAADAVAALKAAP